MLAVISLELQFDEREFDCGDQERKLPQLKINFLTSKLTLELRENGTTNWVKKFNRETQWRSCLRHCTVGKNEHKLEFYGLLWCRQTF